MTHSQVPATDDSRRRRLIAIVAIAAIVALVRLAECAATPTETGDVVRNLLYGLIVDARGIGAAHEALSTLAPRFSDVAWAAFPYNYPPVALAFFALVAAISPTVFAAKLALTLVEAINAILITRLTRSGWLGVLYWGSPLSIWWVSHEGQFEPLQSVFMLLAIAAATRWAMASGVAIALGVATKMTAAALVPWLASRFAACGARRRALAGIGFLIGCVPLIVSHFAYDGVRHLARYSALLMYNPYYWNPRADFFTGNPPWQIAWDAIASDALLATLFVLAWRSKAWLAYLAPLAFVAFCKVHTNVEFWYWLLLPAFLVPLPDRRWRFALIALTPLLDPHAAWQLVAGPVGPNRFHGLPSAFDVYAVAPP